MLIWRQEAEMPHSSDAFKSDALIQQLDMQT